jgi:hypothetical protein
MPIPCRFRCRRARAERRRVVPASDMSPLVAIGNVMQAPSRRRHASA